MTRPRVLLTPLAALAFAQAAPRPPADAAPPESSAAAVGFLQTVVDRRLYSLEGAGATGVSGTVHAAFEVIVREPGLEPAELDLKIACDFATDQVTVTPLAPLTRAQAAVAPFAVAAAQNAFSRLPSRAARPWTLGFAQDGELLRIDYRPPQAAAGGAGGYSEWHRADGTPVRRSVTSFRPAGAASETVVQEVIPVFIEKKGRLLLTELKPGDPDGRFSYTFEYEEKDGLSLLKKVVQQNAGWRLTLDFAIAAERAAAPAGGPASR